MTYKRYVLTHANCLDGCTCREIFKKQEQDMPSIPKAQYFDVDYAHFDHEKSPQSAQEWEDRIDSWNNAEVVMADFCLTQPWLEKLLKNNNRLVVLDHHETALPALHFLEEKNKEAKEKGLPSVADISFSYDNENSGAALTWKYVHGNNPLPQSIQWISDGDTWKFKQYEETYYFKNGLLQGGAPKDIPSSRWKQMMDNPDDVKPFLEAGIPFFKPYWDKVMELSDQAQEVVLGGIKGLMVHTQEPCASELGNVLAKKSGTFGLVTSIKPDGMVGCSLRSIAPFRVNDLASLFGGGGHPQAAAFRMKNEEQWNATMNKEMELFNQDFMAKKTNSPKP